MRIFIGETRRVVTLESFGIVIKLPRVYVRGSIWSLCNSASSLKFLWSNLWWSSEIHSSVRWFLFRGISHNWHEYRFWRKTRNPFLQPTYFSLLGLINIQKFGQICVLKDIDVWCQLQEITELGCHPDGHTFERAENFVMENDEIRIVDYGSPGAREIVTKHGDNISRLFDPTYSWEERKRER